MSPDDWPFMTVAVPVLNEARFIAPVLRSLLDQLRGLPAEILVLDGGSDDPTCSIVAELAAHHPELRLIHNPRRLQSAACNLAAELADPRSRVLLRVDAHAAYPATFVAQVITALLENRASSVVVPMRTVGHSPKQRAIAATQNSRLGNGGASHRRAGASGFVDHGHHAAFDLAFFRSIGGYDPTFSHNEDAEYDTRAESAGGRAWLCADAIIEYFPRETIWQLSRQYVRHGRGRARTTRKHRRRLRLRQAMPIAILCAIALIILAPLSPWAAAPASAYVALCLAWGVVAAMRQRDPALLWMGPAAIVTHTSWAIGFLQGRLQPRMDLAAQAAPVTDRTSAPHALLRKRP